MPKLDRIGRYSVRGRLGSGAFALVWLGHDDVLDAPVAIKVLAENWAHQLDLRARFVEEARVLRRADSDRVVRVFDIGDLEDGRPYFVMTYADRGTLEERLGDNDTLPVREALGLAEQVARGVAVVHGLGVIHRDLKPSNVLFRSTADGERLLIADLGLSKAMAHASGFTVAAGSPGYMAPEQAVMGGGIDTRVDIYGIGAMAYRMLTGVVPQREPSGLTPPSELRAGLPAGTDSVLTRALDPERERRWPSARVLADALAELASRVPPEPEHDEHDDDEPTEVNVRAAGDPPAPPADPEPALVASPGAGSTTASTAPPTASTTAATKASQAAAPQAAAARQARITAPPASTRPPNAARPVVTARRSRRRWPWVLVAITLVLAAGVAGVVTVLVVERDKNGVRTVRDSSGQLAITMPVRWSGKLQGNGWSPRSVGLASETSAQGMVIASDIERWRDPEDSTPGVFVGVSHDAALPTNVSKLKHDGCTGPTSGKRDVDGLSGTTYRFACPGGIIFTEVALRKTGTNLYVYVQLKQTQTDDRTDEILRSLQVSAT